MNEEFGGPQSNLDKLWVKQTYRILKGSHPSSWWWDHFFGSTATGVSTGTFMISNVHLFADTHNYPQSKFTLLDTKLNDVGLPKVIWFTNEQKYRVKPGNDGIIGTYTITHTRTPAANPANNVYTVKKQ